MTASERDGALTTRDGLRLRTLRWSGSGPSSRAIVLVHGYLEHAERYREIASYFAERGDACYAMDLRGHGRSQGVRGYAPAFASYVDDLDLLIAAARAETGAAATFLVAHSYGALIALAYAIDRGAGLAGIAVSAPYLRNAVPVSGARLLALRVLSRVAPRLQLRADLDPSLVSRDPAIVASYASDPLVLRRITPRWASATLDAQQATVEAAPRLTLPLLVVQGGADRVADPSGTRAFFERAGSRDKTLRWYDEHYHENFNELDRRDVYAELESWLAMRASSGPAARA